MGNQQHMAVPCCPAELALGKTVLWVNLYFAPFPPPPPKSATLLQTEAGGQRCRGLFIPWFPCKGQFPPSLLSVENTRAHHSVTPWLGLASAALTSGLFWGKWYQCYSQPTEMGLSTTQGSLRHGEPLACHALPCPATSTWGHYQATQLQITEAWWGWECAVPRGIPANPSTPTVLQHQDHGLHNASCRVTGEAGQGHLQWCHEDAGTLQVRLHLHQTEEQWRGRAHGGNGGHPAFTGQAGVNLKQLCHNL